MSILIGGMEMPREPMVIILFPNGHIETEDYDIGANATAVPIPPHGDLIDRREAVIDANERAYDFWNSDADVDSTISFLGEQPTIIPADPAEGGE